MTSDRLGRVEALYHQMLARPPDERAAALLAACPDDPALAAEVQSLLDQPESAARFLSAPALEVAAGFIAEPNSALTGRRIGVFEVQGLLGAGGMGEVYRARDTRLGRSVALKILPRVFKNDAARLARFEREARVLASLSHPNICALHDVGRDGDTEYLVMELVEGETLSSRLKKGPLPLDQTLRIAIEIADALDKAHRQGVIHRDLKPGNVMLTKAGSKLMDFGLARLTLAKKEPQVISALPTASEPLTGEGTLMGTVPYMAPEQLEGKAPDARSDLWALGCLLYEMATGRPAFEGKSQASLISAIMAAAPQPISQLQPLTPPSLERLVKVCLAKDPDDRLQTAHDVMQELKWIAEEPTTGLQTIPTSGVGRRRFLGLASIALPATAAGVLGYFARDLGGRREASLHATFRRLTFRRGPIVTARFGPDGRSVYYGAAWEGEPFRVYQTRSEGGELPLPFEDADLLSVARDGRVAVLQVKRWVANAWWKKGTLAIIPAAGGAPRELAENVWAADFSPDGRALAVVRDGAGRRRLEYPLGRVLHETDGHLWFPRVSPDGDRVAFFEIAKVGDVSLAVIDRSGQRTVLVERWEDWLDLAWSRDGREIWFAAIRPCDGTGSLLYAVDLAGRRRVLFEGPGSLDIHDISPEGKALVTQNQARYGIRTRGVDGAERELSWRDYSFPIDITPDGRTLLVGSLTQCSGGEQGSTATFVRALDGSPPVRVADGWAESLSPDGRFVLTSGPRKLQLTPTRMGEPRSLATGFDRVVAARWMPDGSVVVAVPDSGEEARLHRVDLENASASVLSSSARFACDFGTAGARPALAVSRDAKQAAILGIDGRALLVPLDGGALRPLPGGEVDEQPVQWSPDGRLLYCYRRGQIPARVFEVDVDSGRRKLWATIRPPSLAATDIILLLSRDLKTGAYGYGDSSSDLHLVDGLR